MPTWDPELYDDKHSWVWKRGEAVVELLAPLQGETILDLGCGTAHLSAQIAKRGARVIGIDASEAMISKARNEFPMLDLRVGDGRDFRLTGLVEAVFPTAAPPCCSMLRTCSTRPVRRCPFRTRLERWPRYWPSTAVNPT